MGMGDALSDGAARIREDLNHYCHPQFEPEVRRILGELEALRAAYDAADFPLYERVKVGDRVSYEDMANPLRKGKITEIAQTRWGKEFHVEWDSDSDGSLGTVSDLRQVGWKLVAWKEHT